ncbi:MAG: hypothetical protein ABF791_11245, partial [Acetobacter sp.]|uniref:hypothetical protein n=1 Tax=Acetobacter sp. TaxID=440 RepID=UPI0039E9386B
MTHRTARTRHVRPCPPSGYRTGAAALLLLSLGGCGYNESRTAHKGQIAVIGMNSEDLQACAGIPDKRQKINDHVEIFQYTRTINTPSSNDSTLFPLQTLVNLSQTTLGGAGKTCVASIRLVDDHVTDMHYSGDDDRMVGTDGVCATVVKGCLNTPVKSAHKIGGGTLGIFNPVSAFYAPTLPSVTPQPQTPPTLAHAAPITTDSTLAAPTPFGQTDDSRAAPEAIRNGTAQAAPAPRNGPVVNTTAQGTTPPPPAAGQAVAAEPADMGPPTVHPTPPALALYGPHHPAKKN